MKTYIPASSTGDSVYLLFHTLTTTIDEVVTRINFAEASANEIDKKHKVCEWLCENVRQFEYGIAEREDMIDTYPEHIKKSAHLNLMLSSVFIAEKIKCDKMLVGYNTSNWSYSNWFYNSDPEEIGTDSFYNKNSTFNRSNQSYNFGAPSEHAYVIRDATSMPIEWPFIPDKIYKDNALGTWQIHERIPEELKKLMSYGCKEKQYNDTLTDKVCGSCWRCLSYKWYDLNISNGFSSKELDDMVMLKGRFGKYWDQDTKWSNINNAYLPGK